MEELECKGVWEGNWCRGELSAHRVQHEDTDQAHDQKLHLKKKKKAIKQTKKRILKLAYTIALFGCALFLWIPGLLKCLIEQK